MKVLLLEDVDNLGYAGEVKDVANGYGRNYLLPREMAVLATPGALKQAETIRKAAEKKRAQQLEDARAIANQLGGVELLFERRAGETGKLYGSVTSTDIAEAIEAETGIAIDKRKVALPEPIRDLGEQNVTIKLMIDMSTSVTVHVLPLGGIVERERLTEEEAAEAEAEQVETAEVPERQTLTPEEADIEISAELPETEAPAAEAEEAEAPAAEAEEAEAPAAEAAEREEEAPAEEEEAAKE
jgi:large subunit ribosomal protein L9